MDHNVVDHESIEHEIITRVQKLSTKLARRTVFHQLVDQLASDEWRDLRDCLNARTFQCDILGSLPPEIAVEVAHYLDLADIHVLQRVSRTWRKLLSSHLVRSAVYHRYTGRIFNFAHRGPYLEFEQYARQRIRLERGEPSSRLHRREPNRISAASLDYSHGRYAWIAEGSTVVVQGLRSNSMQIYCTDNRDLITNIRLSDSIVAAITPRGYCHVWNFQTEETACFRLPSRQFHLFIVRGVKVAFAYKGLAAGDTTIMQWDFSLRVSRMIDVAANLVFMNVHPTLDSLTTVHLEQNDSNGGPPDPTGIPYNLAQLRIMKHWLTDTSNVTQAVSKVVALPEVQDIDLLIQSKTEISEAFNDRVGILIAQTRTRQPSDLGSIIAIAHDLDSDEIFLHVLPPEHTSPRLCLAPIDRNLLYYIRVEQGKPTIWISHPNAQIPYHPAKSMDTHFMRDSMHAHQRDSQEFVLKGDNDCVLLVDDEGMSAWCFDEAAQPSCAITGGIQLG